MKAIVREAEKILQRLLKLEQQWLMLERWEGKAEPTIGVR
jgi:hypothetical protein